MPTYLQTSRLQFGSSRQSAYNEQCQCLSGARCDQLSSSRHVSHDYVLEAWNIARQRLRTDVVQFVDAIAIDHTDFERWKVDDEAGSNLQQPPQ